VRQVGEVAAPVGDEEGLVVLEHELGQVGRDLGGEDVVLLADEDVALRGLRGQLPRLALRGHAARRRVASRL
jgi:hypothetical protein